MTPAIRSCAIPTNVYSAATALVFGGYVIFFFAPTNTMLFIGLAGLVLFIGQAFIQVMMLMFLTDSVEYGEWKFGKRNDSVTFSLQPFINKMGGAVASGVTGAIVIISGIISVQRFLFIITQNHCVRNNSTINIRIFRVEQLKTAYTNSASELVSKLVSNKIWYVQFHPKKF